MGSDTSGPPPRLSHITPQFSSLQSVLGIQVRSLAAQLFLKARIEILDHHGR